jgi:hypothetical protein
VYRTTSIREVLILTLLASNTTILLQMNVSTDNKNVNSCNINKIIVFWNCTLTNIRNVEDVFCRLVLVGFNSLNRLYLCQKYNDNDYKLVLVARPFRRRIVLSTWLWIDFHGRRIKGVKIIARGKKIRSSRQTDS